jgi:hypothetical protein
MEISSNQQLEALMLLISLKDLGLLEGKRIVMFLLMIFLFLKSSAAFFMTLSMDGA